MAFLIKPVVRPNCLDGQDNGRLDPSILSPIPSERASAIGYQMALPAARAYRAMHAAAKAKGLTLKPVSASDTYRPYGVQESIFRQRYTTTVLPGRPSKMWNGVRWYQRPNTAMAATPGTSNHGWGLAVDLGVETDGDVAAESIGTASNPTPELTWLGNNADLFGFSWESLPSEYWHVRHYRGDDLSAAVLAYEAGLDPTPEPEPLPPPQPSEDLVLTIFKVTEGGQALDARFIGLTTSNGVAIEVQWLTGDMQGFVQYANQTLTRNTVQIASCGLVGPMPSGDRFKQWSKADFRFWNAPAA